jgi:hypothetical protein
MESVAAWYACADSRLVTPADEFATAFSPPKTDSNNEHGG